MSGWSYAVPNLKAVVWQGMHLPPRLLPGDQCAAGHRCVPPYPSVQWHQGTIAHLFPLPSPQSAANRSTSCVSSSRLGCQKCHPPPIPRPFTFDPLISLSAAIATPTSPGRVRAPGRPVARCAGRGIAAPLQPGPPPGPLRGQRCPMGAPPPPQQRCSLGCLLGHRVAAVLWGPSHCDSAPIGLVVGCPSTAAPTRSFCSSNRHPRWPLPASTQPPSPAAEGRPLSAAAHVRHHTAAAGRGVPVGGEGWSSWKVTNRR